MRTRDHHRFPPVVHTLLRDALDFLYPPACSLCRRTLSDTDSDPHSLCPVCRTNVAPPLPYRCDRCSAPVGPHLNTSNGCIHCRNDRFAFERVVSLGVYDGPLRNAVLAVKRPSGDVLASALAELLAVRERAFFRQFDPEVIVPVPHHWTDRLLSRHLPPVTLAARLARVLKAPHSSHILSKVRRTPPQSGLTPTERHQNLRGAFRLIGRPRLDGLRVLLVDDVLTTGTTAHRAAALLRKAGATVNVAVLARGLGALTSPAGAAPVAVPVAPSAAASLPI